MVHLGIRSFGKARAGSIRGVSPPARAFANEDAGDRPWPVPCLEGGPTTVLPGGPVILNCNFEELQSLAFGAELLVESAELPSSGSIAAPATAVAEVKLLQPRLTGSITIRTLAEQRQIRRGVAAICQELHDRLDEKVLEYHPAHEEAVALYFDYAHVMGVLRRLDDMGAEMEAMIELMTGEKPTESSAATIEFD